MHKLIDFVCDELEELERKADKDGKLSMTEVQYMDTLAHAKKNLLKSDEMMGEGGYSNRMYHDDGMHSYARRRDSRGRYSSEGYSMGNQMIDELHRLMNEAPDEQTRMEFQRFIQRIDQTR